MPNKLKNNNGAKGPSSTNKSVKAPRSKRQNNRPVYTAPAASTRISITANPQVSGSPYSGDGKITIKHREYIGEIAGSAAFAATSYSINPGLSSTFAWLSSIAANYESYLFKKLSFEFETEKSSSTAGSVQLAVDYDASDATPTTKQALMTYHDAVRSAPWCPCEFKCDSSDLRKFGMQRYNRSAALSSNQDIKTYDVGNLIVGTSGCADTSTLGELYVTYEVELHTPQTGAASASSSGQKLVGNTSISKTAVLGTTPTSTGTAYFTGTSNTLTCAIAGEYIIVQDVTGTGVQLAAPSTTGTATMVNLLPVDPGYTDPAGTVNGVCVFRCTATVGQTVIFGWSGATTVTASNTRIGLYAASLA